MPIVGGVDQVAGGIERQGAVALSAGGAGYLDSFPTRRSSDLDGERAAGCDVAGDDAEVFGHAAGGDAADHGGVVGAVDGDGDDLAGGAVGGDGGEGG